MFKSVCGRAYLHAHLWKCGTLLDISLKTRISASFLQTWLQAFQLALYFKQYVRRCSFPAGNGRDFIATLEK